MSFDSTQYRQNSRRYNSGVHMAPREQLIAALYGDGHSMPDIALVLDISVNTVRSQLLRVRNKYAVVGMCATRKMQLRACLVVDGILAEPASRSIRTGTTVVASLTPCGGGNNS
jgi:DNA-binding CsgD family transcriptional regulator